MIDIIAACIDIEAHESDNSSCDSCCSEDIAKLENWQNKHMKRTFTVRANDDKVAVELLSLSKTDFCRMKNESSDNYDQFFHGAIGEL